MRRRSSGHPSSLTSPVSSTTSAPSRNPPPCSTARTQSSSWAMSRASRTELLTGKPIEYSKLARARAAMNRCVAPAESARTRIGCTTVAGSSPSSWPRRAPVRDRRDGPFEQLEMVVGVVGGGVARSQHGGQGLVRVVAPHGQTVDLKPRSYVGAASSFSVCAVTKVESTSKINGPIGGQAFQTCRRASARAAGMARCSADVVASMARQAVATDATGPNRSSLLLQGGQIRQAVGAVGDGHAQVGEHDTGIVGVPGDPALGHGHRTSPRSDPLRSASSASSACRADTRFLPVRVHLGAPNRATTMHLQGALRFWVGMSLW